MKTGNIISSLFNLEKGEGKLVGLPLLYSFFAGAAFAFFTTTATALLLNAEEFERQLIPLSFVVAGILVFGFGKIFSQLQKRLSFTRNLQTALGFLLLSILAFPAILHSFGTHIVLVFIIYSWVRIFAYIHALTFWGFLSRLLNIQQAKRLFGLISGGEVLGGSIGFLSVPLLVQFISTEDLLLIPGLLLPVAFILLLIIGKNPKLQNPKRIRPQKNTETKPPKSTNFKDSRYFKLFFLIAFIPIFAQMFIDFLFQVQSKAEFPQDEALTSFLGIFFGISTLVEFVLKTFVSGKLINKYGVKLGLLAFPVVTALVIGPAVIFGTIYGTATLFFAFITLARLFARAVRTSFNDPATQILYQPLPENERMAFQNKIESGPKAFGGIAAGLFIFLLALAENISPVVFAGFLMLVVLFWIKLAYETYKEYKKELRKVLERQKEGTRIPKYEIIFSILQQKLQHAKDDTKKRIQAFINKLYPYTNDDYRTSDMIPFKQAAAMSSSANSAERLEAARHLHKYKLYKTEKILLRLMNDDNAKVRQQAVITAGLTKHPAFYPVLVEKISEPEIKLTALSAIFKIGKSIIPELITQFKKIVSQPDLQIEIIDVLEQSEDERAKEFLTQNINHPNRRVQGKIIRALGKSDIQITSKQAVYVNELLEKNIGDFIYQCAALNDFRRADSPESLTVAVKNAYAEKREQIYDTLTVLYDNSTVNLIRENPENTTSETRSFALEIANTVLSDAHLELLLPILEELPVNDILKHYRHDFPHERMSVSQRIADLIQTDTSRADIYTKAQAINALSKFTPDNAKSLLKSNLVHPNLIIKEITLLKYHELFLDSLQGQIEKYRFRNPELLSLKNKVAGSQKNRRFLNFEVLEMIKTLELFNSVPPNDLIPFVLNATLLFVPMGEEFEVRPEEYFYLLITGEMQTEEGSEHPESGSLISFMNFNNKQKLKAVLPTVILQSRYEYLDEFVRKYPEFAAKTEIR